MGGRHHDMNKSFHCMYEEDIKEYMSDNHKSPRHKVVVKLKNWYLIPPTTQNHYT